VRARQDATGSPDAAFVVTQADSRTNVAEEIGERLEGLELPVLQARCGDRVAYAKALGKGVAVEDVAPSGKAAAEIDALTDEINARFYG
jgi:chromosome partitioning protein